MAYRICILFGLVVLSASYDLGTLHKYTYETTVLVNEKCDNQENSQVVGQKLKADVHITTIWQSPQNSLTKLLKIQILNTKLSVPKKSQFTDHRSDLDTLSSEASYILWEEGVPRKVWDNSVEHFSLRNLKRGLASLMQFRKESVKVREVDVSGQCTVAYEVNGNHIKKHKEGCDHIKFDKSLAQPHGVRSGAVLHQSTTECDWQVGSSISKCSADEHVKFFCNAWHKPTLCVTSKSELSVVGTENIDVTLDGKELGDVIEKLKSQTSNLEEDDLSSIIIEAEEKPKKRQLKPMVAKYQSYLATENLSNTKSVTAFYKLLPVFRTATEGEILQTLNNDKLGDTKLQVLDLVAACATKSCIRAGFEYFAEETEYNPALERFVLSLGVLPKPHAYVLQELKAYLEKGNRNEKIEGTLLTILGTVLKTYASNTPVADSKVVDNVVKFLENGLKKCDKQSENCELYHLRSLRNAALRQTVPTMLEIALKGGKNALEALLAIRNISDSLSPQTEETLLKIFNEIDHPQDRSTRALAFEMLLKRSPESNVLKNLLRALSDQKDMEFSTFLASRIWSVIRQDEELRKKVQKLLPEKDISYYYSFAQNGQSSVFTMPMLAVAGTNVTYGLELEFINGGILKRSVFDVSFENAAGASRLLSVGLFASGLASLAGDSSAEGEGDPTAGMELGFLDNYLRPYIFFRSTGEAMGHAWSGTASTPIPVLQCIMTFIDDERVIGLSNGMVVRGQLRGVLAVDGSASAQLSLWNRNAKSLIANAGALLARGAVTVDSGFVKTQGILQFSGETNVDFKIDVDFYETPFTTCLSMDFPDVTIHHDFYRIVNIAGSKYQLKKSKKRKMLVPGRSFAFSPVNNEMCQRLNSS